ncbi:MAG: flagellar motor switch protein FliN [Roseiarcus sp.]|jgi:flagellar motor switch protein FliN/FliY
MDDDLQPQSAPQESDASIGAAPSPSPKYDAILSIPVTVQVVLGATTMPVASLMKLGRGAVISLDQKVGDPVDIVVNGRIVARGEVVVVDEESARYGVSLIEIVASSRDDRAA